MGEAARKRKHEGSLAQTSSGGGVSKLAIILDWPYSMIPASWLMSVFGSDICKEEDAFIVRVASPHTDIASNKAIKYALDRGADEILSLNADQTVVPDILARFRRHNKPIVGALTASRSQAGHPWLIYEYTIDGRFAQVQPTNQLQRVGYVGPGCMLVKSWVFREIKPPWIYTTATEDGTDLLISSDFNFFSDVNKAGIEVYCDTTVVSEHQHEIALSAQALGRDLSRLEISELYDIKKLKELGTSMPQGHIKDPKANREG